MFSDLIGKSLGVVNSRLQIESVLGTSMAVSYLFGIPRQTATTGFFIDVKRDLNGPVAKDGDPVRQKMFMIQHGIMGSALEHGIFEQIMRSGGFSAVKILKHANDSGVPIHFINRDNVDDIVPQLGVTAAVKADIQNVVNAGQIVYVPRNDTNLNGFAGTGYIVLDPETGAGGYFISGSLGELGGGGALLDQAMSALSDLLGWIFDAFVEFTGFFSPLVGIIALIADFITQIFNIYDAYISGTASTGEVIGSLVVWVAFVVLAFYLGSLATPIALASAILAGAFLGAGFALAGAVVGLALLAAALAAVSALGSYIISIILSYFDRRREEWVTHRLFPAVMNA